MDYIEQGYAHEGQDEYVTKTVYDRETGLPLRQCTGLNGLLHAPPDGSPSKIIFDDEGRVMHQSWHAFGLEHREDGPADVVLYPETGISMTEVFMREGQPRQPNQGAYRIRRRENGEIWEEKRPRKKIANHYPGQSVCLDPLARL